MFNYSPIYIVVEPDGNGDFEITASDQEPEPKPGLQYLKTIHREVLKPAIQVYGVNVHIGDIDFEQMDWTYWNFYQILSSRERW